MTLTIYCSVSEAGVQLGVSTTATVFPNAMSGIVLLHAALLLLAVRWARAQDVTVTGTIFANNNASFYINGELIAVDPIHTAPHNALNVSFQVMR